MKSNPLNDWLEFCQQLLGREVDPQQWSTFLQSVAQPSANPSSPHPLLESMAAQAAAFFALGRHLSPATTDSAATDWATLLPDVLTPDAAVDAHGAVPGPWRIGWWQAPLLGMSGGAATASAGDATGAEQMAGADLGELLRKLAALPPLGPGRERQQAMQALTQAMGDYVAALNTYAAQWNIITEQALRRLETRVAELSDDEYPRTLRAIYDLWVDANEAVYAEHALGDAYVQAFADLLNTFFVLRGRARSIADQLAGDLGLPTRRELNALHRDNHARRQRERQLDDELAGIKQHYRVMRKQVDDLRQETPSKVKPSPRPPARRGRESTRKPPKRTP